MERSRSAGGGAVAAPATTAAGGLRRFGTVLRGPGVPTLVVAGLVGRLPMGMMPFAVVVMLRDADRSYAAAGAVVALNSGALALSMPVLGRLVDRLGQARVLLPATALFLAATVALVALTAAGAATPLLALCSVVSGAALPPLGACVRTLWPTVLPSPDLRDTAFALEAILQELIFVAGPLLVVVLVALHSPSAAVLAAGALGAAGTVVFVSTEASRRWRGEVRERRGLTAALQPPGVRTVLLSSVAMGVAFGAVEVAMPAFAEERGARAAGGIALACFSLGSLLGGLAVGSRRSGGRPSALFIGALVALALFLFPPLLAGSLPVMCVLMLLAGLPIAPAFAGAYALVDDLASPGTATEAFAWLSTAIVAGLAIGTGLGGDAIERVGVSGALGLSAAAGLVALVSVTLRRRSLEPSS